MILYEVKAYQTDHYDKSTEVVVRLRSGHGRDVLDKWIADYLAKHQDGKVIVSIVDGRQRYRKKPTKKLFIQTNAAKDWVGG